MASVCPKLKNPLCCDNGIRDPEDRQQAHTAPACIAPLTAPRRPCQRSGANGSSFAVPAGRQARKPYPHAAQHAKPMEALLQIRCSCASLFHSMSLFQRDRNASGYQWEHGPGSPVRSRFLLGSFSGSLSKEQRLTPAPLRTPSARQTCRGETA